MTPGGSCTKMDVPHNQICRLTKVSRSPSLELKVGEVGRAALPALKFTEARAGSVKRRLNLLLSGC